MAKQTITALIDDLDGSPATSTVTFALSGATYEIDLSDANAARLDEVLAPFIRAARPLGNRRPYATARAAASSTPGRRSDLDQIREWARGNGHPVADRGRIAGVVVQAYDAAH